MNRREAVKKVTVLLGGAITVTGIGLLNQGCDRKTGQGDEGLFTAEQQATIDLLAETLIPETDIPGAKAAGVGAFISMMITDCYPGDIQKKFIEGVDNIDQMALSMFNRNFADLSQTERGKIVDESGKAWQVQKDKSNPFYHLLRELTYLGYFSSEIGAKQALAYVHVPGRYDGCMVMEKGQRAWAT